ncbi:MAG: hypothetical protein ABL901_00990 [Hyphomicrobiaceae bacterium]
MTTDHKPWAHISHKNGMWCGVMAASLDEATCGRAVSPKIAAAHKREVAKFCGGYIADGFEIKTVYSREEHTEFMKTFRIWQRPAKAEPDQLSLFAEAPCTS